MERKSVAIVQSCYLPWKGYFDIIASVDEFIFLDDVQYTKRDWRSRNKIKTAGGEKWLTVPVKVAGRFTQRIRDTEVAEPNWGKGHWAKIESAYRNHPHFKEYADLFKPLFLDETVTGLSEINRRFIGVICKILGITTPLRTSMELGFEPGEKNLQLIGLCEKVAARHYVSGPSAKDYLDIKAFAAHGITVSFFDYGGYPEYPQLHPPFQHHVTVLDLLFNVGPAAAQYLKHVSERPYRGAA